MMNIDNPFITDNYISADFFCDREKESDKLVNLLSESRNVAIISNRYMGKTRFMEHCFQRPEISGRYNVFMMDIYTLKSLREFVFLLGKTILNTLQSSGKEACMCFIDSLPSVRYELTFYSTPLPTWNLELGDIKSPETTLDEIFLYLSKSQKPNIVAIDEFQQIRKCSKEVEMSLRNRIRKCRNTTFVVAGSLLYQMGDMFVAKGSPFRGEMVLIRLKPIKKDRYINFVQQHFAAADKNIPAELIGTLYDRFEGITGYMQKTLNVLYSITATGETCTQEMVERSLDIILDSYSFIYSEMMNQITAKQKEMLIAISKEGKASVQSELFMRLYGLHSSFSIVGAVKSLFDREYLEKEGYLYITSDRFLALWLKRTF